MSEQASELIGQIYTCIDAPEHWNEVGEGLRQHLSAASFVLMQQSPGDGVFAGFEIARR
jgi:hypothetical protein